MNPVKTQFFGLFLTIGAIVATVLFFWTLFSSNQAVRLTGFVHNSDQLQFVLEPRLSTVRITKVATVPEQVDVASLQRASVELLAIENGIFQMPLHAESAVGEYSIFVFAGENWFELVRQSPEWLWRTFAFKKPKSPSGSFLSHRNHL